MAFVPFTPIPPQFQNSASVNLSGGTMEFFIAGTNTPTNIYSDDVGTSLGTTVTLNASGYPASGGAVVNLFRDTDVDYKVVLKDSGGSTLWTTDDQDQPIAGDFAITDSGGDFAAANVEDALLEAKGTYKIATAAQNIASSTTLTDDDSLTGIALVAGAHYAFELFWPYTQNVGDLKLSLVFTNAPNPYGHFAIVTDDTNVAYDALGANSGSSQVAFTTMTDSAQAVLIMRGHFQANATTGGTLKVQWAQNTSSANNTTAYEGRWIRVTRISS